MCYSHFWPMAGFLGRGHLGMLFGILFWIIIITGLIWLIKRFSGNDGRKESALDILKRRFASGEINSDEFQARKKEILN